LVDKFYGKFNWNDLLNDLGNAEFSAQTDERCLTTPPHYAYIKISEGCDRKCAYCAIPIITGKHKSRPMEDIISEIEKMVSEGVREFQLIAQELTYYGIDLYKKQKIAELVGRISDIDGVEWIRLHYAYPQNFPDDLLEVMRERKNVCKYLDIALQHVDTKVLSNMRRNITKEETYDFIKLLRDEVPGIHLRTTLMVGYPGEHDEEFAQLKDFIKWAKFERMGAFAYCEEDDTFAAKNFKDEISDEEKQRRLSEIMELQQSISAQVQASKIGKVMKVVIDRKEGEYYIGRTEFDSPEVDPEVLIPVSEGRMFVGRFYNVKIIDSDDFDLYATKIIGGSRGDK
jgi:ribosomal protein S12 methylthiotransferase